MKSNTKDCLCTNTHGTMTERERTLIRGLFNKGWKNGMKCKLFTFLQSIVYSKNGWTNTFSFFRPIENWLQSACSQIKIALLKARNLMEMGKEDKYHWFRIGDFKNALSVYQRLNHPTGRWKHCNRWRMFEVWDNTSNVFRILTKIRNRNRKWFACRLRASLPEKVYCIMIGVIIPKRWLITKNPYK